MERVFSDPFDTLPAYEREIVRLRAYELTLTLYYKEEIERNVLDKIKHHDRRKVKIVSGFEPRAPEGTKDRFNKSLDAMVSDGAITEVERAEIRKAVDFRNDVAHRIDHLFADLEQGRFTGMWADEETREFAGIKEFDHQAVKRMRKILKILDRITLTHYRVGSFSWRGHLMFSSTEKTLESEIRRSRRRLRKLAEEREVIIAQLNNEMQRGLRMLNDLQRPHYFSIRFDLGKMTARGSEFCYILFDNEFSDLAIAHIFQMKLRSIQARRRKWTELGGVARERPDWDALPAVITPSRFDE